MRPGIVAQVIFGFLVMLAGVGVLVASVAGWLPRIYALLGLVLLGPALFIWGWDAWDGLRGWHSSRAVRRLEALAEETDEGATATPGVLEEAEALTRRVEKGPGPGPKVLDRLIPHVASRGPLRPYVIRVATRRRGPDQELEAALEDLTELDDPEALKAATSWLFQYGSNRTHRLAKLADEVPPQWRVEVVRYLLRLASLRGEEQARSILAPFLPELKRIAREGTGKEEIRAREAIVLVESQEDSSEEP